MRRLGGWSWTILAVSGALGACSLGLLALDVARGGTPGATAVGQAVFVAVFLQFGVVGALVASRRTVQPSSVSLWFRRDDGHDLQPTATGVSR